jgi:uncharacterized membrane protein YeaQ/YmgE (transglycosylase-associated protein family)
MRPVDPVLSFMIILLIGIIAGLIFDRVARPAWMSRDHETRNMVTMALIGIAGSFIGYYLTILVFAGARMSAIVPYIGAMIGAALVLWLWRLVR